MAVAPPLILQVLNFGPPATLLDFLLGSNGEVVDRAGKVEDA